MSDFLLYLIMSKSIDLKKNCENQKNEYIL